MFDLRNMALERLFRRSFFGAIVLLLLFCQSTFVWAGFEKGSAHEVVEQATELMLVRLADEKERYTTDPEYLNTIVEEQLVPLIDFKRIARLIMAEHFKVASKEQKYLFLNVFQQSLIKTYASGLTAFSKNQMVVLPVRENDVKENKTRVRVEVTTSENKIYPLIYSMYKNKQGQWLLENIVINGINIGKTYRTHFQESMKLYKGDIDQVIEHWTAEVV